MNAPPAATPPQLAHAGHEHLVGFYETDEFLVDRVVDFVAPALRDDDAAIVVATLDHRRCITAGLCAAGIGVAGAMRAGRYVSVDAADLLARFMVDGAPDPIRFRDEIGTLIDLAAGGRRSVRVYGELVALLLADGDTRSTIAVEDLWNELGLSRPFELMCGYPMAAFDDDPRGSFNHICAQHTSVLPAESYSLMSDLQQKQQHVAELTREVDALRGELDRLRHEQDSLIELAYHDPITGLANRNAFDAHLEREWALAARDSTD